MRIFDAHANLWNEVSKRRESGETRILASGYLDRLRRGGIVAGIFTLWVDTPFDMPSRRFDQILRSLMDELEECGNELRVVLEAGDLDCEEEGGPLRAILGLEGLDGLGRDVGRLKALFDAGFRCASLTWNTENDYGTGVKGNEAHGLSELGREALSFLESHGMIVDVSHANRRTFWDVAAALDGPFLASHSNGRHLCDVPRNLDDEQIRAIAESGGVVCVCAFRDFLGRDGRPQDLGAFVDHIEHVVQLVGVGHAGLGFDFPVHLGAAGEEGEGGQSARGLEGPERAGEVARALAERGWGEADIERICFDNCADLIRAVLG